LASRVKNRELVSRNSWLAGAYRGIRAAQNIV